LPFAVVFDVEGSDVQQIGIVLELPQPAVAVEAEQRSDGAGLMVVVDVGGWCRLADGADSPLEVEQVVRLRRGDSVPPSQVVGAGPAGLFPGYATSDVVTGLAIRRIATGRCHRANEVGQR
jgi:hypothetical protein